VMPLGRVVEALAAVADRTATGRIVLRTRE
jgi:hypothetical protein